MPLPSLTRVRLLAATACLAGAILVGCKARSAEVPPSSPATTVVPPGIENLIEAAPGIWSGGQPHGEADFEALSRMGVRTVVSVDGARPNVAAAEARGLRYIHIPIGYDSVPAEATDALARVLRDAEGPLFVHCHHGYHRGPAATAVILRLRGASPAEAHQFLETAQCGTQYTGLWRDVEALNPAAVNPERATLHAIAPVPSFAAHMAAIDRTWDRLKLVRTAGWQTPDDHPDLSPAHEALMLWESLSESAREGWPEADARFVEWMETEVRNADDLRQALVKADSTAAEAAFGHLADGCKSCHQAYRN